MKSIKFQIFYKISNDYKIEKVKGFMVKNLTSESGLSTDIDVFIYYDKKGNYFYSSKYRKKIFHTMIEAQTENELQKKEWIKTYEEWIKEYTKDINRLKKLK